MEAGALMSYGVNLVDVFRDVAGVVDQVAKGAKAGENSMRQLSHFHTARKSEDRQSARSRDLADAACPRR